MDSRPPSQKPGLPAPRHAFDWSPPSDRLEPGSGSDGWFDPIEERDRDLRRVRACRLAFSFLGFALVLASLSWVGNLILLFSGVRRAIFTGSWEVAQDALVVWSSFVGACLLWGRWSEGGWQGRSGLLVLMGFVDVVLWTLDYAVLLGLSDHEVGHEYFRYCLGHALGWSEFSLIASLAADVAAHLGMPRALDFARGVRSLASVGATLWFLFFYLLTDWNQPIWPLRVRPLIPQRDSGLILLSLGERVLFAISLVQVTALTLTAGRSCAVTLRTMDHEDRSHELLGSPSDAAWDEFTRTR